MQLGGEDGDMRNLYARIVLWLIRPALELRKPNINVIGKIVVDELIKDANRNRPISRHARGGR